MRDRPGGWFQPPPDVHLWTQLRASLSPSPAMIPDLPFDLVLEILEVAVALSPWLVGQDEKEAAVLDTYDLLLAAALVNSTWNFS